MSHETYAAQGNASVRVPKRISDPVQPGIMGCDTPIVK
jgi:hypothetical protein